TYTGYTLTLDTDGGTIDGETTASVTAASGTEIDLSSYVPTRAGYTFTGWYLNGTKIDSNSITLTADTKVTAGWQRSAITVSSYLALGDDITTGSGLGSGETGFTSLFAAKALVADAGGTTSTVNAGGEDKTAAGLLAEINNGTYNSAITAADIITVTVGQNDLMDAFYEFTTGLYYAEYGESITAGEVEVAIMDPGKSTAVLKQAQNLFTILNGADNSEALKADTDFGSAVDACVANINQIAAKIHAINPDAVILVANQYNPYQWLDDCDNISGLFGAGLTIFNNALAGGKTSDYTIADINSAFAASDTSLTNASANFSPLEFSFDFLPNAAGHQVIADTMKEACDTATAAYTWEIPIMVTVQTGGTAAVPEQTIQFEILDPDGNAVDMSGGTIVADTINVNDAGDYVTIFEFYGNTLFYEKMNDGFLLRLVSSGADGWTYDSTAYYVVSYFDEGTMEISNNSSGAAVTMASFTCTYTGYTLTFETNGGSAIDSVGGISIDLSAYEPTRAGYNFTSWYSDSALTSAVTGLTLTGDTTVYAGWQATATGSATATAANYTTLGDSITTGSGLSNASSQSYVSLFSGNIQATNTNNQSSDDWTTTDLLSAVQSGSYDDAIEDADVITIAIGENDLMNTFCSVLADIYNEEVVTASSTAATGTGGTIQLAGMSGSSAEDYQFTTLSETTGITITADDIRNILSTAGSLSGTALGQGYDLFVLFNSTNYGSTVTSSDTFTVAVDKCVDNINSIAAAIKAVNPNATILVANQYNPYQWLTGCDNLVSMFDAGITSFNSRLAAKQTSDYTIADVYSAFAVSKASLTNVDVKLLTMTFNFDTNPNAAGHQVLADTLYVAYAYATNSTATTTTVSANTGDNRLLVLYYLVVFAAAGVLIGLYVRDKRLQQK
ncbi:MAG: InlB B-repeat-containing protein, partial [Clostridiales bacterium]|nr:InlB B-repeat-containing protein [Clostridiales bacterium]